MGPIAHLQSSMESVRSLECCTVHMGSICFMTTIPYCTILLSSYRETLVQYVGRCVFMCVGGEGCVQLAEYPLAFQLYFSSLSAAAVLCSMDGSGKQRSTNQSKTTKFDFLQIFSLLFSFSPSSLLETWHQPSQLYNQAIHLFFIDRCYF